VKLREFVRIRFHTVRKIRDEPAIAEITRAVLRLTPHTIGEMTDTAATAAIAATAATDAVLHGAATSQRKMRPENQV
jgi:hypothetical protein